MLRYSHPALAHTISALQLQEQESAMFFFLVLVLLVSAIFI
jgi:hypothetical protein